jgi:hypothetical protein
VLVIWGHSGYLITLPACNVAPSMGQQAQQGFVQRPYIYIDPRLGPPVLLAWLEADCNTLGGGKTGYLKRHGNEPDFPRFLHKSVRHRSLKLHFEPFRFWLRILGYIHILKTTPRLNDTGSGRLSVSTRRRVGDSQTQQYVSRRLSASLIRGVDDSPHHRFGE